MNKRQKLVQQQYLDNEQAVIKRLEYIYDRALFEINDKIRNLEFAIGDLTEKYDWMDVDDPARAQIKSKIQSKIYQKQYQQALKNQLESVLNRMQTEQFVTVSAYLDQCYEDGFIGNVFDLHGQGIPLLMPLDQTKMVRAIQLESKISKGLYRRLGEDVALLKKRIAAHVTRSIATGATFAQMAKQLAGQTRIGYNNAVRIARTEGHRIQTTATMDVMGLAKDNGADVVKQWDAALDKRTRKSHQHVDGEIRELDEPFSNGLMFPGDPDGRASEVINCRCALLQRAMWALDADELETLKKRAKFYGLDKPKTFDDFKKKYLGAISDLFAPITLDMFPEAFHKNSAVRKTTRILVDALNDAKNLNPNIRRLYTHINDLDNLPAGYQISCTGKGHALEKWINRSTNTVTKCKLKVPKMLGDDLRGQKSTAFHEIGHLIDLGAGKGRNAVSKTYQKLTDAIKLSGQSMSSEVKSLFADFSVQYKQVAANLQTKYRLKQTELTNEYVAGKITYSDYQKRWNASIREGNAERDYQARNLCGGGVTMLSDIYDALSGGVYQSGGTLIYGHGQRYYSRTGAAESEIFANYMSLSINNPELVEMLRRDKPELCSALDQMIEEMAGEIK